MYDADMFDYGFDIYVNPVNTKGVMGAGLAKRFAKEFPEIVETYRSECQAGTFKIGTILPIQTKDKIVVCFPTKDHWKDPSKLEYIEAGLKQFADFLRIYNYPRGPHPTIGMPALGCGLGGLNFEDVEPLIIQYLDPLPAQVTLFCNIPTKQLTA